MSSEAQKTVQRIKDLESRISIIEERNKRVELDKAWETSALRRLVVIVVTYLVVLAFLFVIKNDKPFINAIVPSIGFLLSTLAVTALKRQWISSK